jgi:cytochrome c-type biogenesis protein CcmE
MPSEETRTDDVPEEGSKDASAEKSKGKRVSEKKLKMIVVVVVVAVLVAILLWGMVPDRIYELREVHEKIDDLDGQEVSVKGVVISWEAGDNNFTFADTQDNNLTIEVTHTGPIPEGFGIEATAVIKGIVHKVDGQIRMDSEEIQIGCPSKY